MNETEYAKLNIIEGSDKVNYAILNENTSKIEAELMRKSIKNTVTGTTAAVTATGPWYSVTNSTAEDISVTINGEAVPVAAESTVKVDIENIENDFEISLSSETDVTLTYFVTVKSYVDSHGGGGGGGTSNYNDLSNRPSVNNIILAGNKTAEDLGLVAAENGKGLSTNDFTAAYKKQLDDLPGTLEDKVDSADVGAKNGIASLGADGKVPSSQLPAPVAQKEFKLVSVSSESYAAAYKLQVKDGETWSDISGSATINIPKDMVVESGSVKECTADNVPVSGYKKGDKYIDLVIANKADAHIYINVKDLIDNKADGIQYSNTTSKLTATNVQSAIDEIVETLKDKVDETELLSFKEEMYEQTGGKSLWSVDKKTISTGAYLYNGSVKLPAGKYKFCFKTNKTSTGQLKFTKGSTSVLTKTLNYTPGLNEFPFELTSESDTMSIWANAVDTYTELAIIRDGIPAEPYIPVTPTNSELNTELKTNLLSTIVASSNASASNVKTVDFQGTGKALEKLVIEGKTVQDGTPSPSAPVEVKGVGDIKNLLQNNMETQTIGGVKFTKNPDGSVTLSGTSTGQIILDLKADYSKIEGKNVILTGCPVGGSSTKYSLDVRFKKADGSSGYIDDLGSGVSFNESEITWIAIVVRSGVDCNNLTFKPMVRLATDSDATFIPYGKYKIPISVAGKTYNVYANYPLLKIGNYADYIDYTSGCIVRNCKMITLNGTEEWSFRSGNAPFWLNLPDKLVTAETNLIGISNTYATIPNEADWTAYASFMSVSKNNPGHVRIRDTRYASSEEGLAQFVQYIKNQYSSETPVVIAYPLATPTEETFDAPEISTVVGKNTLAVGTDVTPTKVEVTSFGEYYSKSEVDKMLAERDEQINSVIGYNKISDFLFSMFNGKKCTLKDGYVMRVGNQVHINLVVTMTAALAAYQSFIILPSKVKTPGETRLNFNATLADGTTKKLYIDNNIDHIMTGEALDSGAVVTIPMLILDISEA